MIVINRPPQCGIPLLLSFHAKEIYDRSMSEMAPQLEQDTKDRISMARMICVLGMIFVHVPDGESGTPVYALGAQGLSFFLEGFLVEGPGRASAALLSVVSGYLAAVALLRSNGAVLALYRKRFVSIVVPMVFWGVVTYAVYLLVSQSRPTFLADATTWLDKLNIILFITEMPIGATMHLGFLRDLFVCILLSPLLLMGVKRMPWVLLPLLGLFYVFDHGQSSGIILRPLILFAFSLGLLLAVRDVKVDGWDRFCPLFVALAAVSTALIMLANGGAAGALVDWFDQRNLDFSETVLYPLSRLFGSLAIWTLLPILMGGRFQTWVLRFSPYLFAAFCSHYLMLTLLFFGAWQPLFGDRHSAGFIIWFLSAPLVAMIIAVVMVRISLKISPPLATMITGGRITKADNQSPMAERRRQGAVLGIWIVILKACEAISTTLAHAVREWWAASRRLLLGRR